MKQQASLAAGYLTGARYLLLDEPMNALDPTNLKVNSDIIRGLCDSGAGILMSSHILGNIDDLADCVLFIKDGAFVHGLGASADTEAEYRKLFGWGHLGPSFAGCRLPISTREIRRSARTIEMGADVDEGKACSGRARRHPDCDRLVLRGRAQGFPVTILGYGGLRLVRRRGRGVAHTLQLQPGDGGAYVDACDDANFGKSWGRYLSPSPFELDEAAGEVRFADMTWRISGAPGKRVLWNVDNGGAPLWGSYFEDAEATATESYHYD